MRVLAIECSTDIGSLALLDSGHAVVERTWTGHDRGRQAWVADLHTQVRDGTISLDRVDLLAVGTGPGAFSGLRMAIALIRGLAMPVSTPVYAVASGAALAWRTALQTGCERVVVAGDARRREFWLGRFRCQGEIPAQEGEWEVSPCGCLPPGYEADGVVWVTPDWHRIGEALKGLCPPGSRLIDERRVPQARDVAMLAEAGRKAGVASAQLAPIYLHPAVSVAPRYAAGT